jgi:hypothetical protein
MLMWRWSEPGDFGKGKIINIFVFIYVKSLSEGQYFLSEDDKSLSEGFYYLYDENNFLSVVNFFLYEG